MLRLEEGGTSVQASELCKDHVRFSSSAAQLLAKVGKELTSSLELPRLLDRLVRAVVPDFADWSVVDVVEGSQQLIAVAHVDPAKEELARDLQREFQPITSPVHPMRDVLASGQPRYIAEYSLSIPCPRVLAAVTYAASASWPRSPSSRCRLADAAAQSA
jgi:hypothetical protein